MAELLYVAFNQDAGCFACGTDQGFRIYNCEPFRETFRRDFASGGIGIVEMLFRCNILALVGGGRTPRYPPHKVMIWDDHQNRCIGEISFPSDVKAVRLRRDRVVAAMQHKVYVYNFADLRLLDHIDTYDNPRGLLALCANPTSHVVVACPGTHKGHVRIENYDMRRTTLIAAHEAPLACIALNATGTRVATASEKGTLIRVFDTATGELLQELRRGTDKAEIYSIAFNSSSTMLACTSDKGTVHIWKLHRTESSAAHGIQGHSDAAGLAAHAGANGGPSYSDETASSTGPSPSPGRPIVAQGDSHVGPASGADAYTSATAPSTGAGAGGAQAAAADNAKSSLAFMKGILPKYFSSEWSFAQFRVPETRSIVAFGSAPDTITVVGADGSFFGARWDERGGEAIRTAYAIFGSN